MGMGLSAWKFAPEKNKYLVILVFFFFLHFSQLLEALAGSVVTLSDNVNAFGMPHKCSPEKRVCFPFALFFLEVCEQSHPSAEELL